MAHWDSEQIFEQEAFKNITTKCTSINLKQANKQLRNMSAVKVSWKSEQSPVKDPAILAFQRSPSETSTGKGSTQGNSSMNNNTRLSISRELGVVEKLLSSYGFLQCANRQGRLFFHFSEVASDADSLKVGDLVEFQQSSDRRTGKPIAVSILRVPNGSLVTYEIISEKTVTGTVLAEAKASKNRGSEGEAPSLLDGMGRVTYEQSGETFFLPFALEDIEGGQKIQAGDTVEFYISTDERNGNIRARQVRKIRPTSSDLFQGVVCSLKDNYGFIERADVVKEIFFHFSEFQGDIEALNLGDDVEFNIQIRNNKEVAVNIQQLPEGTVVFEDVGVERKRGKILKTLKSVHGRMQSDPLAGRIVYETLKGSIEIPYGDRDQLGDYTLQVGDIVEFYIATDRRDKLQRATNICLVDVTFTVSGEKRERGFVTTLKDAFGFIRCLDRDARMFFHYSEILNQDEPQLQDEVEFTTVQDPTNQNRMVAIRIKVLPKGTISVEQCLPEKFTGTVEKEASKIGGKGGDSDIGIIMYDVGGTKQTIPYSAKALTDGLCPKYGDQVEFQICECRKNNTKTAAYVRILATQPVVKESPVQEQGVIRQRSVPEVAVKEQVCKEQGFLAILKENCGFIEMADHEKEVFFQFNYVEGNAAELELGDEVEFTLSHKTAKVSAENIRKLSKGTVAPEELLPGIFEGKIVRTLRIINPDQVEYCGLVQQIEKTGSESGNVEATYPYGVTSLVDKRDIPQKGETVRFQVAVVKSSGKQRATRVAPVRLFLHGKVESMKGQTGVVTYEGEEGKRVSFHLSEVQDGVDLQPGDEVEFVVIRRQSTGKYAALSVRKTGERQRPERLMSRLKSTADDLGPKVVVIRQPRGPDGTKGFKQSRSPIPST